MGRWLAEHGAMKARFTYKGRTFDILAAPERLFSRGSVLTRYYISGPLKKKPMRTKAYVITGSDLDLRCWLINRLRDIQ
jgi:hypothetical protein